MNPVNLCNLISIAIASITLLPIGFFLSDRETATIEVSIGSTAAIIMGAGFAYLSEFWANTMVTTQAEA